MAHEINYTFGNTPLSDSPGRRDVVVLYIIYVYYIIYITYFLYCRIFKQTFVRKNFHVLFSNVGKRAIQ